MALSEEQSVQQAEILKIINLHANLVDLDYLRECHSEMKDSLNRQLTLSVLNPSFSVERHEVFGKKSEALGHFIKYVEALKEAEELAKKAERVQKTRDEISKLFF